MAGNINFRSAVVGGFNRQDVISYIENYAKEHAETVRDIRHEMDELSNQLSCAEEKCEELELLNTELKNQLETNQEAIRKQIIPLQEEARLVTEERAEFKKRSEDLALENQLMSGRIEQLEKDTGKLNSQNDSLREHLGTAEQNIASLTRSVEEKDALIAELRETISAMESDHRNYLSICSRLGRIEAEMQSRAAIIEEEAEKKAQALMDEANAYHEKVIFEVQGEAEVLRSQLYEHLEQARNSAVSTSEDMNRSVSTALGEVSNIQFMLEQLSDTLVQQITALHAVTMDLPVTATEEVVKMEVPDAPEKTDAVEELEEAMEA